MYFDEKNNYFDITDDNTKYNYTDINVNIDSINFSRDISLYSPQEGFNKGNMFQDLYSKYKNHVYKLKVNNQKDDLLYKIQMYLFALIDYNLYLDIYPNDTKILREFRTVKNEFMEAKKKYEDSYGPLCMTEVESTSNWSWLNGPWPWDKGGNN